MRTLSASGTDAFNLASGMAPHPRRYIARRPSGFERVASGYSYKIGMAVNPCCLRDGRPRLAFFVYVCHIHAAVAGSPEDLEDCAGFEWDEGNANKNWMLHQVSTAEAEAVFFNRPFLVAPDAAHSKTESRFAALGKTNGDRRLTIVFTVRGTLVRVISVRDMSRRERRIYEQASAEI